MSRRGVAMLVALLTMTVVITAVAIIARVRTTNHLVQSHARNGTQINNLLLAADAPIQAWLSEQAAGIVLAPDADSPMSPVLDDEIVLGEIQARIQITAWDQHGMYSRNAAHLGLDLPVSEIPWEDFTHPGLDAAESIMAYPSIESPSAIGGVIATHNPWPTRSGTTRARGGAQLNINTAPRPLVEAVFGRFNLGDPGWIFEQRVQGELALMTQQVVREDRIPIQIVSVSRVWSFRIDVRLGTINRSCWCVYANQGGNWRLVQRIVLN